MARVTLKDVAVAAGVSRATASLVLRGSPRIPEQTAERVRAAMAELGYVYDRAAAMMREHRTMTVGLVMTDLRNPFFAELTMALEDALHREGFTVLVGWSRDETARQGELLRTMAERRVDGLFLLPAQGTSADDVADVEAGDVPVVQLARRTGPHGSYAGPDNVAAGRLLGEHLREIGVRRAVLLGGPAESSARTERVAGLLDGARGALVLDNVPAAELPAPADPAAVAAVLDDLGPLDCLVGYNDVVAIAAGAALRARGVEPGTAIAVAGFDDVPSAAHQAPPLTSVATHPDLVGAACAAEMLARIGGAAPQSRLVEPDLHVRASTTAWSGRGIPTARGATT